MNVAEAQQALDASATKVLEFAKAHNWRDQGPFALFVQNVTPEMVKASQDAELARDLNLPLVATAGMKAGAYAALGQLVQTSGADEFKIWMSTHVAERTTQAEFVAAATGRVLVAGLGLGLVLGPLLDKPEVTKIVVVDVNQEVLDIMGPYIESLGAGDRLKIVVADINLWKAVGRFDTIYFDIWPTISAKNLVEMAKLRRRYAGALMAGGYMGCWAQDECMQMLKAEERRLGPRVLRAYEILAKEFGYDSEIRMCRVDESVA